MKKPKKNNLLLKIKLKNLKIKKLDLLKMKLFHGFNRINYLMLDHLNLPIICV